MQNYASVAYLRCSGRSAHVRSGASVKDRTGVRLLRFGLTGGIAAALIFIGLWMAAQLPIGPSHMMVELFTGQPSTMTQALREGAIYSALVGFLGGALVDLVYHLVQWVEAP